MSDLSGHWREKLTRHFFPSGLEALARLGASLTECTREEQRLAMRAALQHEDPEFLFPAFSFRFPRRRAFFEGLPETLPGRITREEWEDALVLAGEATEKPPLFDSGRRRVKYFWNGFSRDHGVWAEVDGRVVPVPHWFLRADLAFEKEHLSFYTSGETEEIRWLQFWSDGASDPTITFPEGDLYETRTNSIERFGRVYEWKEIHPKSLLRDHIVEIYE